VLCVFGIVTLSPQLQGASLRVRNHEQAGKDAKPEDDSRTDRICAGIESEKDDELTNAEDEESYPEAKWWHFSRDFGDVIEWHETHNGSRFSCADPHAE
jgi:hypothetical protein